MVVELDSMRHFSKNGNFSGIFAGLSSLA